MRWDEAPRPYFYLPYAQNYASRMTLHIESTDSVIGAVRALARDIPATDARTLREYFDNGAMFGIKIALRIAAIAGGGGLALALAGLYGVVSSTVNRRRREIGIRVALGAPQGSVLAMIVRQGMSMAAVGTTAGICGSQLVHGLVAPSAWACAAAAGLMLSASLAACAVPAMRALRVDPAAVLRED
jgi:ABC-type antimicrobial peptide transport system permease subunit